MSVCVHLSDTDCRYDQRLIKQVKTIEKCFQEFSEIFVFGMTMDSDDVEAFSERILINRVSKFTFSNGFSGIARLLSVIRYFHKVYTKLKNSDVRIIHVHRWWLLPGAIALKILHNAKLLYDAHELETETAGLTRVKKFLAKVTESMSIKFVNSGVFVSESIRSHYKTRYPFLDCFVVLNAPYKLCEHIPAPSHLLHTDLSIPVEKKVLVFHGGLSRNRGIERILTAIEQTERNDFVFLFIGDGPLRNMVQEYAARDSRILLSGMKEHGLLMEYLRCADVGVFLYENNCLNHYFCLPNKLFEYAHANLFIAAPDFPEIVEFIEQYKYGILLNESDTNIIDKVLAALLSKPASPTINDGLLQKLSWQYQEKEYCHAIKCALGS